MDNPTDDGILDEEHVHWKVLGMRIFCFLLLFLIIVCCSLEEISPRFLVLAAMMCGLLVLIILATFIDLGARVRSCWHMLTFTPPTPPVTGNVSGDVVFVNSKGKLAGARGYPSKESLASRDTFSPMQI